MAAKATKIADIKSPGKTAPSASSRPLLVTNRPVLENDPMVTTPEQSAGTGSESLIGRTAKTIKPISTDLEDQKQPETSPEVPEASEAPEKPEAAETPVVPDKDEPAKDEPAEPEEAEVQTDPEPVPVATPEAPELAAPRDSEASAQADAAKAEAEAQAEAARQAELEELIASGKYRVPINAVHRQHSRSVTLVLSVVVVLLAIAALDAALDANLLDVSGIPHTNLLRDR